jgi:hypothetical protein
MVMASGATWISNEAPNVFPEIAVSIGAQTGPQIGAQKEPQ